MLLSLLFGCLTTKSNIYEGDKKSKITEWYITFEYEISSTEETSKNSGEKETTNKKEGQYSLSLQLMDDIYFYLKDNYPNIKVYKDPKDNIGIIKIHPVINFLGGKYNFESLDVKFYDNNN
jgi:hypothetical protein